MLYLRVFLLFKAIYFLNIDSLPTLQVQDTMVSVQDTMVS